ncbi:MULTISPECIES: mandelate racemase/muconate lactonizing enzyme family protein [unclassified Bradyrhizobium]|uniref:mandelate racemase/muconate lactonizing enzyme family protein n=1 Tax=unclassified Bradyrhizobium TaxID=2631580 RepID=UPI0003611814|nr:MULTISPECIES: mandelate racemase/muconate lactonizing enzyme family protein [unclassified Bradyrhizobium]MCK1415032.1 mandelate racemase/muconate lactonizing enzyme family protein [Bradyrhizobium sp. CW4]MCK1472556.1 mandelate racemase/muconate lactonizing enzyme family protein [Bradyrhizobium sp. CW10]MCK1487256.1 mandelate racemase/muconate lactonizing enzyme family protein [Bradyrhizobium sp. 193]MCK1584465.1 mandelate racemase/muconate lactonizing enzyme family protein [Bradyrhizobium sp
MKITDVRAHHIRIPYDAGVASFRQGASAITALDMVILEVTTDAGLTGWGDAFAYVCPRTTRSAVEEMIAPQAHGLEVPDAAGIPAVMDQIQRNLHLFGRYGITMFAISGLDIALWDLAAKIEGVPLNRLLGDTRRSAIPAYASLLRIGSPDNIAAECKKALALGYGAIKLHETTAPAVFAARAAIGPGIPLMVDMNCPLSGEQAVAFARTCGDAQPMFLEEPVWPPEDFAALAEVRSKGGLGVAAGENACTEYQFRQMMEAGAVSHAQPSVIKVGGITEFLKVAALADRQGVKIVPHSPYFGPGLLATLHLLAGRNDGLVEMFYLKREACLWGGRADVDATGHVAVPTGPGLGYEPDRSVMERYRVA